MRADRLASTIALFILDDLKLRRADWPLVADVLADILRRAAHHHSVRGMTSGNERIKNKRAAEQARNKK